MKKVTSLLLAFIALAVLVYSFMSNQTSAEFFGLKMNVWTYRLIWFLVGVGAFYDYKKDKINKP